MSSSLQWYPGHMAKTRRLIEENIGNVDIICEIVDARIPFSGRNPLFNNISVKPRLIILNKADLADEKMTVSWINAYKNAGISVIPVSCSNGSGINKIIPFCLVLIAEKIEAEKAKGKKHTLKLMMTGIPNVGKSSVINRLARSSGAKTGDIAGVTRGKQWINAEGAELLDMPGILPPKFENNETALRIALTGSMKDSLTDIEELACKLCNLLRGSYPENLCARYKLDTVPDADDYGLLQIIGKKRGFIVSGGEIDTNRTAVMLLDEFRSAKIGRITLESPAEFGM